MFPLRRFQENSPSAASFLDVPVHGDVFLLFFGSPANDSTDGRSLLIISPLFLSSTSTLSCPLPVPFPVLYQYLFLSSTGLLSSPFLIPYHRSPHAGPRGTTTDYGSQGGGGGLQGLQGFGDDVDGSGRGAWQELAATYSLPVAGGGGGGDEDSSDGEETQVIFLLSFLQNEKRGMFFLQNKKRGKMAFW